MLALLPRSAGIAIHAGTAAVGVGVPEGWRDRVAISWGGSPASSTLRFGRAQSLAERGTPTRAASTFARRAIACRCSSRSVESSTTVRIGIGRACGARR
jgi:hypothetical protein